MRAEDRRAYILHPEFAVALRRAAPPTGRVASIQDADICLHCRRHQCIAACAYGAISTQADGRARVDPDACAGSGACLTACFEFHNLTWAKAGLPRPEEG
jgi:Fe-S-cluster-containing dehydrogenase component